MSLAPDTRLGVYEVTAMSGEDGTGEIYQARDTIRRGARAGFGDAISAFLFTTGET